MAKRQVLYHVTEVDHGPSLTVKRIVPNKSAGEPATPRLCTSICVANCFGARLFRPSRVTVYRTPKPVRGVTPTGVWDAEITKERWLLPGQTLERVGYIQEDTVYHIVAPVRRYHRLTGSNGNLMLRLATIVLAHLELVDFFDDPKHRKRYCSLWDSVSKGREPAEYIDHLTYAYLRSKTCKST